MDPVVIIIIVGGTMILSAILGGIIAYAKNRCFDRWAFFCFVFPPLVIILLLLPKSTKPKRSKLSRNDLDEELQEWLD